MNRREIVIAVALVSLASPASPASADPPPLTHTTPLTPTGELVPAGHGERTQSLAAFHHDLAVGLADGVELRLQSPLLPVPVVGGALARRGERLARARDRGRHRARRPRPGTPRRRRRRVAASVGLRRQARPRGPVPARDAVHAVVGGAWFAARDLEIRVAAMIGWRGDTVVPVPPLLSFRWIRDL